MIKWLTIIAAIIWTLVIFFYIPPSFGAEKQITFYFDYPDPSPDLAGFQILSSPTQGGPYTIIGDFPAAPPFLPTYEEKTPVTVPDAQETILFFVAIAYDKNGNKSGYSNEVNWTFDFKPPQAIINLKIKVTTPTP